MHVQLACGRCLGPGWLAACKQHASTAAFGLQLSRVVHLRSRREGAGSSSALNSRGGSPAAEGGSRRPSPRGPPEASPAKRLAESPPSRPGSALGGRSSGNVAGGVTSPPPRPARCAAFAALSRGPAVLFTHRILFISVRETLEQVCLVVGC
jgi:hypothetical protein